MNVKYRMKTFVVLTLSIMANALGNTFLSKGMKELGNPNMPLRELARLVGQGLRNPMIWSGIGLLIIFYVLFLASLSWADLTFVLPIVSSSYVVNALFAKYLLGEPIPVARWAGIILVSLGVYLVSKTRGHLRTG